MRRSLLVAGLALGFAAPARAQRVLGQLVDLETRAPLAGGLVTLRTVGGERIGSVAATIEGRFEIRAPGAGLFYVEVNRLGYQLLRDGPFELETGGDREVVYSLRHQVFRLAPIEVTAEKSARRSTYLEQVGFYERQKADFGHYLTRDQIEARQPHRFTDLMMLIPGVRVVPSTSGIGGPSLQLRGSLTSHGGACIPQVLIDGLIVIRGTARPWRPADDASVDRATEQALPQLDPDREQVSIDDLVMPNDVEAVEVFRSGVQVPVRFGGTSTSTQCGVIAIWTRRGRRGS